MVKRLDEKLDAVFHALADPTRRQIVRKLCQREYSVSELAAPFQMSLVAASKHITVLERANLVTRTLHGRTRMCTLNTRMLSQATDFLSNYEAIWNERFDQLEELLAEGENEQDKKNNKKDKETE